MRGLFMVLVLLGAGGQVWGENLLGVAPLRVVLTDAKPSEVMTLTNRSSSPHSYKVVLRDEVMTGTGSVIEKDDFPYSAKRMLRFMPRQITLAPGQRQNIRVMATPPEGLAEGEYHTHLIFAEVAPEHKANSADTTDGKFQVNLTSTYDVGLPMIYQHGQVRSNVSLDGAKLVKDEKGNKAVEVALTRTGNGEATGLIKVVNSSNVEVVQARTMHVYREADHVLVKLPLRADIVLDKDSKLVARMEQDGKVVKTVNVE